MRTGYLKNKKEEYKLKDINAYNLDILKEVCNIASGNALKSLIDLTGLNLDIRVPDVRISDFRELPMVFGSEDNVIGAVSQEVKGDFEASMLLGLDGESINILLSNINKKFGVENEEVNVKNLSEVQLSTLSEVGGILSGSYISAISDFIKTNTSLSVPNIAVDMSGAILTQILCDMDSDINQVLLIGTDLCVDGQVINAKIVLLPQEGALDFLLDSVKKHYVRL